MSVPCPALLAAVLVLAPAISFAGAARAEEPARPADPYYEVLTRETIGAGTFTRDHPTWDGRGVVVAVLDTGVDPSVPGLRTTSTGEMKVIGTRDFSGEGDVRLALARPSEEAGVAVLRTADGVVRGAGTLSPRPAAGRIWLGFFSEEALRHSEVRDVNRNGKSDDRFAIAAAYPEGGGEPVAWVDTDGDGDLTGEEARRSYEHDPRWFSFAHPDPREDQTPVAFTLAVLPDGEPKVEVHFDDGGHGSHCAGIAAGFGIQGQAGFDGIAPGAKVLSLKIGNNNLSGGSTTPGSKEKAIAYAARWAREHGVPVVMNISYGIGSEKEGDHEIDRALDEALLAEPLLVAAVSAGNEGPGLSTVGTPAGARHAWTAGALLTPENAKALWGGKIDRPRVFAFSSRGGELAKPDGLTPGVAWSTVPPFLGRAVMAGTSMASPQAAGAHALLVSAALDRKVPWNAGLLSRALRATAKPLPGYSSLEQGAGVVHVGAAWEALRKAAPDARTDLLLGWAVSTPIPHRPGEKGSGSFLRTGSFVPAYPERVPVEITPAFLGTAPASARNEFFATLSFRADEGWIQPDRTKVAFRGGGAQTLHVRLDPKRLLGKPGVHVAHLVATPEGESLPAFTVPFTVVVPHLFRDEATRSRRFEGRLEPGGIARIAAEVPPGATALALEMKVPEARFGNVWLNVYDPDGRPIELPHLLADSKTGDEAKAVISGERLVPGVWEVVPSATFRNQEPSDYELRVTFAALDAPDEVDATAPEKGGLEATWNVTWRYEDARLFAATAKLLGDGKVEDLEIEGPKHELAFTLGPGHAGARFSLRLSREDYARFTDVAVDVLDASGNAVVQTGFTNRYLELEVEEGPGDYTLRISGGTAAPPDAASKDLEWKVHVERLHRYSAPIALAVSAPDTGAAVTLYPGVPTPLELSTNAALPALPSGFHRQAEITLEDRRDRARSLVREIALRVE